MPLKTVGQSSCKPVINSQMCCEARAKPLLHFSVMLQVLLVVAVEHVLLFLKYWLESIVPRMPDTVSTTQSITFQQLAKQTCAAITLIVHHSATVIALTNSTLAVRL
jgi:hypothetical protein